MRRELILLSLLGLLACNGSQKERYLSSDFKEIHKVAIQKLFDIEDQDAICSISLINNKICFENEHVSPVYNFYNEAGEYCGSLGNIGHGSGEFLMPHLCEGKNDTMIVIDNGSKMIYSVYEMKPCYSKKSKIGHSVNKVRTIRWPYIGYYYYDHNRISWNIYNVEKEELIESLSFEGDEPYLETFTWSSYDKHLVFAYKYYNKFCICDISSEMKLIEEVYYCEGAQKPQENKCYYSDVVCCKDYFIVLSQKNILPESNTGTSKVQIFNYNGIPLKELILDNIYLSMEWNEMNNRLYLIPLDNNEIRFIQL